MSSRRLEELGAEEIQPSWLPDEIMYLIMLKLMVFPIFLARFSTVCKRWHQLACDAWPKLIQEHQINPLVLVPLNDQKKENVSCRVHNLMGECAPTTVNSLPFDSSARIIGSSFGWLIITSEYKNNQPISLFNPLSKSHIRLPPLSIHLHLVKGVLSKPPPHRPKDDQHFDIAVTLSPRKKSTFEFATKIAFLHVEKMGGLESLHWVYSVMNDILDVNSIGGRICILCTYGMICCCRCSTYRFSDYYVVLKEWPRRVLTSAHYFALVYLVESSSSEPLVVFRYKDYTSSSRPTVGFKIITLTSSSGNIELNKTWNWTEDKFAALEMHSSALNWTEIKILDNDVLFLDNNASICIQAAPAGGGDCIYFLDEYKSEGTNFDVFNVGQSCVTHLSYLPNDTMFPQEPPIWLMPSYNGIFKFSCTLNSFLPFRNFV